MTDSPTQEHTDHEQRVAARRPPDRFAITVRGRVQREALGSILPHEHVLFDLRASHQPLAHTQGKERLGDVRRQ